MVRLYLNSLKAVIMVFIAIYGAAVSAGSQVNRLPNATGTISLWEAMAVTEAFKYQVFNDTKAEKNVDEAVNGTVSPELYKNRELNLYKNFLLRTLMVAANQGFSLADLQNERKRQVLFDSDAMKIQHNGLKANALEFEFGDNGHWAKIYGTINEQIADRLEAQVEDDSELSIALDRVLTVEGNHLFSSERNAFAFHLADSFYQRTGLESRDQTSLEFHFYKKGFWHIMKSLSEIPVVAIGSIEKFDDESMERIVQLLSRKYLGHGFIEARFPLDQTARTQNRVRQQVSVDESGEAEYADVDQLMSEQKISTQFGIFLERNRERAELTRNRLRGFALGSMGYSLSAEYRLFLSQTMRRSGRIIETDLFDWEISKLAENTVYKLKTEIQKTHDKLLAVEGLLNHYLAERNQFGGNQGLNSGTFTSGYIYRNRRLIADYFVSSEVTDKSLRAEALLKGVQLIKGLEVSNSSEALLSHKYLSSGEMVEMQERVLVESIRNLLFCAVDNEVSINNFSLEEVYEADSDYLSRSEIRMLKQCYTETINTVLAKNDSSFPKYKSLQSGFLQQLKSRSFQADAVKGIETLNSMAKDKPFEDQVRYYYLNSTLGIIEDLLDDPRLIRSSLYELAQYARESERGDLRPFYISDYFSETLPEDPLVVFGRENLAGNYTVSNARTADAKRRQIVEKVVSVLAGQALPESLEYVLSDKNVVESISFNTDSSYVATDLTSQYRTFVYGLMVALEVENPNVVGEIQLGRKGYRLSSQARNRLANQYLRSAWFNSSFADLSVQEKVFVKRILQTLINNPQTLSTLNQQSYSAEEWSSQLKVDFTREAQLNGLIKLNSTTGVLQGGYETVKMPGTMEIGVEALDEGTLVGLGSVSQQFSALNAREYSEVASWLVERIQNQAQCVAIKSNNKLSVNGYRSVPENDFGRHLNIGCGNLKPETEVLKLNQVGDYSLVAISKKDWAEQCGLALGVSYEGNWRSRIEDGQPEESDAQLTSYNNPAEPIEVKLKTYSRLVWVHNSELDMSDEIDMSSAVDSRTGNNRRKSPFECLKVEDSGNGEALNWMVYANDLSIQKRTDVLRQNPMRCESENEFSPTLVNASGESLGNLVTSEQQSARVCVQPYKNAQALKITNLAAMGKANKIPLSMHNRYEEILANRFSPWSQVLKADGTRGYDLRERMEIIMHDMKTYAEINGYELDSRIGPCISAKETGFVDPVRLNYYYYQKSLVSTAAGTMMVVKDTADNKNNTINRKQISIAPFEEYQEALPENAVLRDALDEEEGPVCDSSYAFEVNDQGERVALKGPLTLTDGARRRAETSFVNAKILKSTPFGSCEGKNVWNQTRHQWRPILERYGIEWKQEYSEPGNLYLALFDYQIMHPNISHFFAAEVFLEKLYEVVGRTTYNSLDRGLPVLRHQLNKRQRRIKLLHQKGNEKLKWKAYYYALKRYLGQPRNKNYNGTLGKTLNRDYAARVMRCYVGMHNFWDENLVPLGKFEKPNAEAQERFRGEFDPSIALTLVREPGWNSSRKRADSIERDFQEVVNYFESGTVGRKFPNNVLGSYQDKFHNVQNWFSKMQNSCTPEAMAENKRRYGSRYKESWCTDDVINYQTLGTKNALEIEADRIRTEQMLIESEAMASTPGGR